MVVLLAVFESSFLFLLNIVQSFFLVIVVHEVLLQTLLTEGLVVVSPGDFFSHVVEVLLVSCDSVISVFRLLSLMISDHLQVVPQHVMVVLLLPEDHLFCETSVFQDLFVVCLVHRTDTDELRSFALRVGIGGICLSQAFGSTCEARH